MLVAILTAPKRPPLVEIAAIADTFHEANNQSGEDHYKVVLVSEQTGPLDTSAGPRIVADAAFDDLDEPIDTLIIVPFARGRAESGSPEMIEWVRRTAPQTRRYGSTCTGAFVLGAAGLLSGHRVTTHWAFTAELAERFPDAIVESDSIFIRDGPVFTSAGVTSAFDLVLALIEEDLGRGAALEVAKFFVMFLKRPGNQSQFSAQLTAQHATREPIQHVQQWIQANLKRDLSVAALARQTRMSERTFARAFTEESRMTPAAYVELARIDAARRRLEQGMLSLQQVAFESGFSSLQAMRRAFGRHVDVTPSDYRDRFRSAFGDGRPRDTSPDKDLESHP